MEIIAPLHCSDKSLLQIVLWQRIQHTQYPNEMGRNARGARRHKFPHLLIFNMRFLSSSPILVHNNCLCWKNSPRYTTPPTTGVIIGSGHRTIGRKAASARGIHIEGGSILELGAYSSHLVVVWIMGLALGCEKCALWTQKR